MKQILYIDVPWGRLGIAQQTDAITDVCFGPGNPEQFEEARTPLLEEAARQLRAYLAGSLREFDLPLAPKGTDFEKHIWAALETIPYGETRSYGQIARQVGNPKACRAVGRANGLNPIAIIIPCHRVIGASGALTGYAGGLEVKRHLLRLEGLLLC